ncbi:hypothetical protein SAMD00019534_029050 [Acytostelium subglobosum LB1]|uniref:hypothetical protein n=1 Tax=Acytostelium subglobosum LB1 TaxID=1410327 RepID=UPI000644C742|nr:hypothetical protein SAMD00019534_029050 [Acytostelium subglobosum LB1]GAM19730.1 hypothetical protein SAMD00019534_029050 [Acytostelium subglobosum LB1]|eukprot:XP_012756492.1 hypothetical protein SAMD00019534_029050 [Acytostelium subglobosum LB1]
MMQMLEIWSVDDSKLQVLLLLTSTILVVVVLVLLLYMYVRPRLLALFDPFRLLDTKCHFCHAYNKVPLNQRNNWTCITCDQYNGFNSDGDYNIDFSAMVHNQQLQQQQQGIGPIPRTTSSSTSSSSSSQTLCAKCQYQLQTKTMDLQQFEAETEDWSKYERYRRERESQFKLCAQCEAYTSSEISRVNRYVISTQYNNQFNSPKSSPYVSSPLVGMGASTTTTHAATSKSSATSGLGHGQRDNLVQVRQFINHIIYLLLIVLMIHYLLKIDSSIRGQDNSIIMISDTIELAVLASFCMLKSVNIVVHYRIQSTRRFSHFRTPRGEVTFESIAFLLSMLIKLLMRYTSQLDISTIPIQEWIMVHELSRITIQSIISLWKHFSQDNTFYFMFLILVFYMHRTDVNKSMNNTIVMVDRTQHQQHNQQNQQNQQQQHVSPNTKKKRSPFDLDLPLTGDQQDGRSTTHIDKNGLHKLLDNLKDESNIMANISTLELSDIDDSNGGRDRGVSRFSIIIGQLISLLGRLIQWMVQISFKYKQFIMGIILCVIIQLIIIVCNNKAS